MTPPLPHDWIATASKIIGVPLVRHTLTKATGPCPACHAGVDRLIVFEDGNYWCNRCHVTGWWLKVDGGIQRIALARVERIERQSELQARIAACQDWQGYHATALNSNGAHIEQWLEQGMTEGEIDQWGLGFCEVCPLSTDHTSLTIPVFGQQHLLDIRHRLVGAPQGDKYRSHLAGLLPRIFNQDALKAADIVLVVEGEKKCIASVRAGYPASLGMPGAMFGEQLLEVLVYLDPRQKVILALDPDKSSTAERLALQIGSAARVADFPAKPDDFLARYGAKAYAEVVKQARPVRVAIPRRSYG